MLFQYTRNRAYATETNHTWAGMKYAGTITTLLQYMTCRTIYFITVINENRTWSGSRIPSIHPCGAALEGRREPRAVCPCTSLRAFNRFARHGTHLDARLPCFKATADANRTRVFGNRPSRSARQSGNTTLIGANDLGTRCRSTMLIRSGFPVNRESSSIVPTDGRLRSPT